MILCKIKALKHEKAYICIYICTLRDPDIVKSLPS